MIARCGPPTRLGRRDLRVVVEHGRRQRVIGRPAVLVGTEQQPELRRLGFTIKERL